MAIKILLASQQDQEKLQCYKLWNTKNKNKEKKRAENYIT